MSANIAPGAPFPAITVKTRQGENTPLIPAVADSTDNQWHMVVVYRGQHCPICAKYLKNIEAMLSDFNDANISVVAVSADSPEQLNAFCEDTVSVSFPMYAGLTQEVMEQLGLYKSAPMSDNETDHVFSEPALFVVRPDGNVQIIEIANAPFVRPDLEQLLNGLKFIQKEDYPVRGTKH